MADIAHDSDDLRDGAGRPPCGRLHVVRYGEARAATPGGSGGDRRQQRWAPLVVLLSSATVLALAALDAPVRAVPVLAYLAIVPGLAWVRLIDVSDRLSVVLLGIVLSLALGTLVAQIMINLRHWSPFLGLSTLVIVASIAAVIELYQGRRRWTGRAPDGGG